MAEVQISKVNIPLMTALGAIPVLVAAIVWLSNVSAKADSAAADAYSATKNYSTIREDLAEIKGELKYIRDNLRKK